MAFPEQIVTERLILKRPAPATFDLATKLYEVADKSRETLREWLPWPDKTHSPEDEYTHYLIEWCQKHWEEESGFAFIITLKESEEIIGCVDCCHISPKDKCGEIGYWLSKCHVGKGYMQESVQALQAAAFEWGLNRIYIRNDTLNSRSVHIPERLGYHLDGVMRQDCWDEVHQRFRNTNFWSLLKSEWEEKFSKKG